MDVKTSSGRVVSILNSTSDSDSRSPLQQHQQYRPRQHVRPHLAQSRRSSSSSNSMSAASPHTPALSRTDSDDSRTALSPSPITPTLAYETQFGRFRPQMKETSLNSLPRPAIVQQNSGYHHHHSPSLSTPAYDLSYPLTPAAAMGGLSLHAPAELCKPAPSYPQQPPQQEQSGQACAKPATKKNSYPCPVARQYGCSEYFTTSGHAARHAKKHTGRKDAICPECSKAFTRKDNMEQHRRTHSGVRGAPRSAASLDETKAKKVKLQEKRAQPPSAVSSPVAEANMLDPRLMENASQNTTTLPSISAAIRPHLHRSSAKESLQWILDPAPAATAFSSSASSSSSSPTSQYRPSYASHSHAPALDALALAASRQ